MAEEVKAETAETGVETTEQPQDETKPTGETWKNGQPFNAELAQSLIEKLRHSETELKSRLDKMEREQADAQRKADEEQGKFQPLYEQARADLAAKSAEADSVSEMLQRANALLLEDVKARVSEWPDEVKNLIPISDDANALELKERVKELQPLADKLLAATGKPGNPPGPVASRPAAEQPKDSSPRPMKYYL